MGKYNAQTKYTLDSLLLSFPGVEVSRMFGYPGYRLNGRAFVFLCGDGIAVRLPEERAMMLTDLDEEITPFEADADDIWQCWVYVERPTDSDYCRDLPMFEESIRYVTVERENKNAQPMFG